MSTLPPPPLPTVYAVQFPKIHNAGKVNPDNWHLALLALLALQETRQARESMRDVDEFFSKAVEALPVPAPKPRTATMGDSCACETCGKVFVKTTWNQKYCSFDCKKTAGYQGQAEARVQARETKQCLFCGGDFSVRTKVHKLCSPQCSKKWDREQERLKYREAKEKGL
jgi:hypothetical protein